MSVSANGSKRGRAKTILRYIDADSRNTHWRDLFNQLDDRERDALADLLFSIALCRKIRKREFGILHQLLKIGYDLGLADTPASSQAAEMLARLATFADVTKLKRPRMDVKQSP
jgi:hypothetical protein